MKTRKIEVYIAYTNHTWDTKIIEIPKNTPDTTLNYVAQQTTLKLFFNNPKMYNGIAFIGIYNSKINDEKNEMIFSKTEKEI